MNLAVRKEVTFDRMRSSRVRLNFKKKREWKRRPDWRRWTSAQKNLSSNWIMQHTLSVCKFQDSVNCPYHSLKFVMLLFELEWGKYGTCSPSIVLFSQESSALKKCLKLNLNKKKRHFLFYGFVNLWSSAFWILVSPFNHWCELKRQQPASHFSSNLSIL